MNNLPNSNAPRLAFGLICFTLLCLVCSCGKNLESIAPSRAPTAQDPEVALENKIQSLFGQMNDRRRDVDTLIRGAGPGLTPDTRNKAKAARYDFYPADKYVEALRAGETAARNKLATLIGHQPTNSPAQSVRTAPGAAPDESAAEFNFKSTLLEVRTVTEELAMNDSGAAAQPDNQPQSTVQPYSPDEYIAALQLAAMLMERKEQGLRAEATFYRNLLGLDEDNIPVQKK